MRFAPLLVLLAVGCAEEEEAQPVRHPVSHHSKSAPAASFHLDGPSAADIVDDARARQAAADKELADIEAAKARAKAADVARADAREATRIEAAKAHADECAASFPARAASTKKSLAQVASLRATRKARCSQLQPKCVISQSGHFACAGASADDIQFFDGVCMAWPAQLWLDGSAECADVDKPTLSVTEESYASDVAGIVGVKP